MHSERFPHFGRLIALLILAVTWQTQGQTIIISTAPANGTTGVSPTTTVIFTFSTAMNTDETAAIFYDSDFNFITTTDSWSAGNTVLSCTPQPSFPANKNITWIVNGESMAGAPLGPSFGTFNTGTGGGSGGSGTNAITTFSVGKVHHYNQTSAGPPTLDPLSPYGFSGVTALASNRTATSVTLTLPTAAVSNLTHLPPPSAEIFLMSPFTTSLSAYDATFPPGDYSFFVQGASSNQTVVVNLPTTASQPQPGAPHLTNYPAAQTVDPSQPFVLGWDAFPGGTAADYIDVDVGDYRSPDPGLPGALTGTARTFTIPAGTLQPDVTYLSRVGFFRHVGTTNASYATAAYRATYTEFALKTTGGVISGPLVLTNASYSGTFNFDVLCSAGQTVTVDYRTDLSTGVWLSFLTTNSVGNLFRVVAPHSATNRSMFFRARNGL